MSPTGISRPHEGWGLRPGVAGELARAVDELHAETGLPQPDILSAIVVAGLSHREEVGAILGGQRLDALLAALPAERRAIPDLAPYDQLLTAARRT